MKLLPPENTADKEETKVPEQEVLLSLKKLCQELSISTATGRNWVRQKKLTPKYMENQVPYFTEDYVTSLKMEMRSGRNAALKSRRNKSFISGNALYRSYVSENCQNVPLIQKLLKYMKEEEISPTQAEISYLAADCALHLFSSKGKFLPKETPTQKNTYPQESLPCGSSPSRGRHFPSANVLPQEPLPCGSSPSKEPLMQETSKPLLLQYLNGELCFPGYAPLLDTLLEDREAALCFCEMHPRLFCLDYIYEPGEDILGLLYLSCKNIGSRKAAGAYYTPAGIVKKLIARLPLKPSQRILDPCCGTGHFLLNLPKNITFENIFGNDMDSLSVAITRINMALKFPDAGVECLCEHITQTDYLTEDRKADFHHIIGNPPWGYKFSDAEKEELRKRYRTAAGTNIESYDVFMERALSNLKTGGTLSFILPEAILNVKTHTAIRSILLENTSIRYLEYLGNPFDRVQCPSILLQLSCTRAPLSTKGMVVADKEQIFEIHTERTVTPEAFHFLPTDSEYALLEKIRHTDNLVFLAGNADFALGIVTGNNKKYLSSVQTAENEPVLKGADLLKYHIQPAKSFLHFQPEEFQQAAPETMYRAPEKLFYRFICSQLIFAYDEKQTLSLNSCNIVIPRLPGLHMKYVLAVLNSSVAQFIFQKEFHSVKVLRSHIERIPIPTASQKTQEEIISLVDRLILEPENKKASTLYEEIDAIIASLFGLNGKERELIRRAGKPGF